MGIKLAHQTDIYGRIELNTLIDAFYQKAMKDPLIGFFFIEIVKINLNVHIPQIVSFWDMILFKNREYTGNPHRTHKALNDRAIMEPKHFRRWVLLFHQTVDEYFSGENADLIKKYSKAIAERMSENIHR